MKKLIKEAYFNKQKLKSNINGFLSEINSSFNTLAFRLSPLAYKFKLKSTGETLYGMKVISTINPNLVLRFNLSLDFPDDIHSISCWKTYYPINRKYPTPEYTISGFNEEQKLKSSEELLDEIKLWLRRKNKQSTFLNGESIISIDSMPISDMYIQKEINEIFNLSKDTFNQKTELSQNIEDIEKTDDSIVLVLTDVKSNSEESEFVLDEIRKKIDVISGINYFIKNITTDELAVSLWLNSKKNNEIIILDNFNEWANDSILTMINDIVTKGEINYQFQNEELKPSDYPEDGVLDFTVKFIIITQEDSSTVGIKDYKFLKNNTSYENLYIDQNQEELNSKMNEILPNFLPKMTSSFKKDTIKEILKMIDNAIVNITIPELALLFEVKLVCKKNWISYFKEILENLPKT